MGKEEEEEEREFLVSQTNFPPSPSLAAAIRPTKREAFRKFLHAPLSPRNIYLLRPTKCTYGVRGPKCRDPTISPLHPGSCLEGNQFRYWPTLCPAIPPLPPSKKPAVRTTVTALHTRRRKVAKVLNFGPKVLKSYPGKTSWDHRST